MKQIFLFILFSFLITNLVSAQVTVNSNGLLSVINPTGTSNFINLSQSGEIYALDMQTGDLVFRPNGSTTDGTYSLKLTDDSGFPAEFYGRVNLNGAGGTGVALEVNGDEAIWYNGTYFSWGFDGQDNYFADWIGIGVTNPGDQLHINGGSTSDIRLEATSSKYLRFYEGTTQKAYFGHNGTHMYLENDETDGSLYIDAEGEISLLTNDIRRLNINQAGNIGIGVTDGETKVHIYDGPGGVTGVASTGFDLAIEDDDWAYISLNSASNSYSGLWFADESTHFYSGIVYSASTNDMWFRTGNVYQMFLKDDGKLGIGTSSPIADLHVVGGVALENPGFNKVSMTGVDNSQRFAFSTNTTSLQSSAFYTIWGDETHGAAGADPAREGELAFQCKYMQVSANKNVGSFAGLDFEVKANGNTYAYGDLYANGVLVASDRRLKRNIKSFDLGLETVKQINPKQYHYNGKASTESERIHTGVIAQEIANIIPEAVTSFRYDDNYNDVHEEYLAVDEGMIKFMLINAVKELDEKVVEENEELRKENQELTDRLTDLEAKMNRLEALLNGSEKSSDQVQEHVARLSASQVTQPSLAQNRPNPFSEETVIEYSLPEDAGNSVMEIFDNQGRLLKAIPITTGGQGQVTIQANDVPSGTYTYQLRTSDGFVASKKMVIIK